MAPLNLYSLAIFAATIVPALTAPAPPYHASQTVLPEYAVELGPRPYYLVNDMDPSPLKSDLISCKDKPKSINRFAIGHRGGGTLQFPEETRESILAGARMGAGILECDVAFTSDLGLVCRHSFCDLHNTTDILQRPELARKCSTPFQPADPQTGKDAEVECCTSDITLEEFRGLCGKMDGGTASATSAEEYQGPPPEWRTTLYATCGTVLTLDEWIDLVKGLPGDRDFTPELKTPTSSVSMPFQGPDDRNFTQEDFARAMIQAFKDKGVPARKVWPQSFLQDDIFFWLREFSDFGKQSVLLDERVDTAEGYDTAVESLSDLKERGVNIVAPDTTGLVRLGGPNNRTIEPSSYALRAKELGFDIVTWTLERSGPLGKGAGGDLFYYTPIGDVIDNDGDQYDLLDALVRKVGVMAVFTDWAATVVYYADCFGLKGPEPNV